VVCEASIAESNVSGNDNTSAFTCGLGPRLNWERASTPTMIEEIRFAGDSPLEGAGFELSVPREGLAFFGITRHHALVRLVRRS
jgi:hypothetical protein